MSRWTCLNSRDKSHCPVWLGQTEINLSVPLNLTKQLSWFHLSPFGQVKWDTQIYLSCSLFGQVHGILWFMSVWPSQMGHWDLSLLFGQVKRDTHIYLRSAKFNGTELQFFSHFPDFFRCFRTSSPAFEKIKREMLTIFFYIISISNQDILLISHKFIIVSKRRMKVHTVFVCCSVSDKIQYLFSSILT